MSLETRRSAGTLPSTRVVLPSRQPDLTASAFRIRTPDWLRRLNFTKRTQLTALVSANPIRHSEQSLCYRFLIFGTAIGLRPVGEAPICVDASDI